MHALKMAVFDFDGTLVDSVPAIARGCHVFPQPANTLTTIVRLIALLPLQKWHPLNFMCAVFLRF